MNQENSECSEKNKNEPDKSVDEISILTTEKTANSQTTFSSAYMRSVMKEIRDLVFSYNTVPFTESIVPILEGLKKIH